MVDTTAPAPRILILESDRKTCTALRGHALKGWRSASVQTNAGSLEQALQDAGRLTSFDVLLVGCDFTDDGTFGNATLRALRALTANPRSPPVILLTSGGSEYTAVQAMRSGAFDYIPKELLGKEQIVNAVDKALASRAFGGAARGVPGVLRLFGYDVRHCLSDRDNVSVHVAYSAERSEQVVIKVLRRGRGALSQDGEFQSFVDEFKLLHDIDDPAVPDIYDFRLTADYCYIAMEYFANGHLGRLLGEPLVPERALATAAEIAQALSIVHAAGIVHRDLKPGNIMLRDDGSAALIDFGISRSTFIESAPNADAARRIDGTPYYMSPEQASGARVDERSDLYALGVIVFQMLTGHKPYAASEALDILEQHRSAPLPQLPAHLQPFQALLDGLLAKSADDRIRSARELIETLQRLELEARELSRAVPLAL